MMSSPIIFPVDADTKTFGASAPLKELQRKFGFEPDQVVTVAKDLLSRSQRSHASVAA